MSCIRRSWRPAAIAALTMVAAMLLGPATANAHFFLGHFPHTQGQLLHLGYTVSGSYQAQQHAAARAWYWTPTKLVVFQEDYATSEEDFYGYAYSGTWWGMATLHPCPGLFCIYRWADLQLNTNTLGGESGSLIQKVAVHEFGHGIGLAHVTDGSYPSVMRQGYVPYDTPQQHDIDDVNFIYP